jgi:hypothetical protein
MKNTSRTNRKHSSNTQLSTIFGKKNSTPLSFNSKPGLNFVFGYQLVNTPHRNSRQALVQKFKTTKTATERTVKIDLRKYENHSPESLTKVKEKTIFAEKRSLPNPTEFVTINMDSYVDSESEVEENELELLKENLNNRAEIQKTTLSLKTTEQTSNPSLVKKEKFEKTIEKLNKDLAQCKEIIIKNDKTRSEELLKEKERHSSEVSALRLELENIRRDLSYKEVIVLRTKTLMPRAVEQLIENKGQLRTFVDLAKEASKVAGDSKISDQEKLIKYQFVANYSLKVASRVNLDIVEELIKEFKGSTEDEPPIIEGTKKYENLLKKLRDENSLLSSQTNELKKLMETRSSLNLKENIKPHIEIPFTSPPSKDELLKLLDVKRLAQILVCVHKKSGSNKVNGEEKIKQLEEMKSNYEREIEIVMRKIADNVSLIAEKDKEISRLESSLKGTKELYEKTIQDVHLKNVEFINQMKEVKNIFNEMRKEKVQKQSEIEMLRKRIEELEQSLVKSKLLHLSQESIKDQVITLKESSTNSDKLSVTFRRSDKGESETTSKGNPISSIDDEYDLKLQKLLSHDIIKDYCKSTQEESELLGKLGSNGIE